MSIIIDDLGKRGADPRKVAGTNGGEYHGPCPMCGGRDRFHVWPEQGENGTWWCRGCQKGGDAIEYLRDYCGMDFKEAAAAVGRDPDDLPRAPVTPRRRKKPEFSPTEHKPPADLWREHAEKLVSWAHGHLLSNKEQMAYLAGRGIGEASVHRYRLGYNPGENGKSAIFRARKAWGLPGEALWIPRGIVIPLIVDGVVHRIRIRREKADLTPDFNLPYYVLPGASAATMVVGGDDRAFVVVEAELDAIACAEASGDLCCAAAMGSSSTKPDAIASESMRKSLCILNALDFDEAGAKAWKWWKEQFERSKRWPVPNGKDPGDAFANGVNLRAWILAGLPPVFRMAGSTVLDGDDQTAVEAQEAVEKEMDDQPPAIGDNLPESVVRVSEWLRKYPVRVVKDAKRIRMQENRKWASENIELSRKINLAIFMDPVVFDYVLQHPGRVIDGKNFVHHG